MRKRDLLARFVVAFVAIGLRVAIAEAPKAGPMHVEPAWLEPPRVVDAPGFAAKGVRAVYFDSIPWKGSPTRAFAWIGLPDGASPNHKAPGMVLVHGGGGTAFDAWVRLWTARGYAAVAMDTCGQVPRGKYGHYERDPRGGPRGWGGFDQIDLAPSDQWTYHAIADVILAHSLLRSLPEVDANRTGITGISWGGYLTSITAGLDARFKLAVPVYGCGFLGDNSTWLPVFTKLGKPMASDWLARWDPSVYLPSAKMPMLWVDGTNDFAYPLDSLQKSYRLPIGPRFLATRVRMPHGHGGAGENPEEIHALTDSILQGGYPMPRITGSGREGTIAWAKCISFKPIAKAELNYTRDTGVWQKRKWETIPATLSVDKSKARATLPEGTTVYYFNFTDDRGLIASSEHEELSAPPATGPAK